MKKAGGLEYLQKPGSGEGKVIMLFHGYGADAYDLTALARQAKEYTWIFPNGPERLSYIPGFGGRSWFPVDIRKLQDALETGDIDSVEDAFPSELSDIRRKVQNLITELNIPLSKIFLGGFSQGAVLALEIALHAQEKPAGLILLSGTVIHEHHWKRLFSKLSGVSFFQSHGYEDPLLPFDRAKKLEGLLQSAGLQGKLHPFAGQHEIPPSTLEELKAYLKSQA